MMTGACYLEDHSVRSWISYEKNGVSLGFFHNNNNMLFNFHYLLILIHRFLEHKKIKTKSKVDTNATDVTMNQNDNSKNTGEANKSTGEKKM